VQRPIGRPSAAAADVMRLERGRKQWPIRSAMRRRLCSDRGDFRNLKRYAKGVMQLCVVITHAIRSTIPRQIAETFQASQLDLPT